MIPDFQTIMLPLLRLLENGQQYPMSDVILKLRVHFGLSEEDLRVKVPSRQQPLFKNRITWAISYLKNAGLVSYPQRGVYQITDAGRAALKENPKKINLSYLKKFDAYNSWQSSFNNVDEDEPVYESNNKRTPDEQIGDTIKALHAKLALELLEVIKRRTPAEFEAFVLRLLIGMGYGGVEERSFEVVGQSGDNGVDGIIYQDHFGIDRIYVQAKKWADSKVAAKDIRDFIGALSIQGTNKGVFITTSEFTKDARDTIKLNPANRIILIDGQQLAEYAIKYNVGVQVKVEYQIKTLDNDFFEEL